MLLTLLSRTEHSVSMILKSGDCAGPGKMLKCIFVLLKPRLNTCGCMCGRIAIVKNCIIVRKQHLDHRMHLVTQNIHIVTGSNLTTQSNYRTSRIPTYWLPKSSQICLPCFTVGTRHSGLQATLGVRPEAGNKMKDDHLIILRIASHQTSKFYDYHTICFAFQCCFV